VTTTCRHTDRLFFCPCSIAAIASLALAQSAAIAQDNETTTNEQPIEEIVVTGSRIARRDFVSPSPISTIDRATIDAAPHATMEDLINRMPQVLPDYGRAANNPGDGTARLNLRGLGAGRSLVLFNARRLAPSGTGSAVDVNNIPQALIERVEIITGGASTVYGSDALAGVVNFITRDNFQGFSLEARYGVSAEGDADSYDINVAWGTEFSSGRGNIVAYAGYFERSEVFAGDRELTRQPFAENTETGTIELDGSFVIPATAIVFPPVPFPDGDPVVTFNPDGTPRQAMVPDDLYNFLPANYLQIPHQRYTAGVLGSYEMNNGFEWYLESSFARNESGQEFAPVAADGFFFINSDNPLMTPETMQIFEDFYLVQPGLGGVFLLRRMLEAGSRHRDEERDYWRTVLGLRGELGGGWDIDGWVTYTESDEIERFLNDVSRLRLQRSLLVNPLTGECFDPSNGCVGADIFGEGAISDGAAAFLRVPKMTNTARRVQKLASVFVRGSPLDTWAGQLEIATGLEWRSDNASFRADDALLTGDTLGFFGDAPVNGKEEVTEVYVEAIVPMLSDSAGGQQLDVEIGGRYSKYKNAGGVETYKFGGTWRPADSLLLRVMSQRSVRAPNNQELFQEQFVELGAFIGPNSTDDPCSASADPIGNGQAERCVIQGLPESEIGVFEATPFFPTDFVFGGNPDLRPEEADTLTIGAVLTPGILPNWNFAVDYYEIELDGEIGEIESDFICFDQANTGNSFCDSIRRGPTGDVVEVENLLNNRGIVSTKGIDTQIDYQADLPDALALFGGAQFGLNLIWTHVLEELRQENVVAQVIECDGFFGSPCGNLNGTSPKNRVNTTLSYTSGALGLQLNSYWIEGTDSFRGVEHLIFGGDQPVLAVPSLGSKHYLNLNIGYELTDSIYASLGISNLLDTDAPFLADNTFDRTNTDTIMYDVFGRSFHVSFSMRLGD
jgi:outer membrane receptor protein involved in Fe transport